MSVYPLLFRFYPGLQYLHLIQYKFGKLNYRRMEMSTWLRRVHDVTVQAISVQCKEYMKFVLGYVTVRFLGRFGTKLEKAVPLRYKHRKMYILMFFLLFLNAITPFWCFSWYLWALKHLFPIFDNANDSICWCTIMLLSTRVRLGSTNYHHLLLSMVRIHRL